MGTTSKLDEEEAGAEVCVGKEGDRGVELEENGFFDDMEGLLEERRFRASSWSSLLMVMQIFQNSSNALVK
jgi:hypothetical protein